MGGKISVLLSAYNGEKYIEEQLISLAGQSMRADEVLIIDDCSSDNTAAVIEKFIAENALGNTWKIIINLSNKGWKYNFRYGLELLHGDYIFFCDQDDIWLPDKIRKTMDVLKKFEDINVVGTNVVHFYPDGREKFEGVFDHKLERIEYKKNGSNFKEHPAGCTMAVRKSYIDKIKDYYISSWSHDEFFWRYATVDKTCILIHDSYLKHRISGSNVTSLPSRNIKKRVESAKNNALNYYHLYEYCLNNTENMKSTIDCIKHFADGNAARYSFLLEPKLVKLAELIIRYRDIYFSSKQLIGDVLFGYRNRFNL